MKTSELVARKLIGLPLSVGTRFLSLMVRDSEKVLYQGEVRAISAVNAKGNFDILPQHANIISIVKERILIYQKEGSKKTFNLGSGILRVWQNEVQVFLRS